MTIDQGVAGLEGGTGGPEVAEAPRRIVVGVDDTPASRVALAWATGEAVRRRAVVEVVTAWPERGAVMVHEVPGHYNVARDKAVCAQQRALQPWDRGVDGPTFVRRVDNAHPVDALLRRSRGAELLVVGAGRPRVPGAGTVGRLCDLLALCPVVVVEAS